MNNRFWVICSVICMGLLVLSALGLSSLGMHRKGLEAERQQEFMAVAKQISFDVKKKVDAFLQTEQSRLYTDYQLYYVPEASNRAGALVQSPLTNSFFNGFATGYFQLDSGGQIVSPHFIEEQTGGLKEQAKHAAYFKNVRQNLLPSLQNGQTVATHRIEPTEREKQDKYAFDGLVLSRYRRTTSRTYSYAAPAQIKKELPQEITAKDVSMGAKQSPRKQQTPSKFKGAASRRSVYPISNLTETQQVTQVLTQSRDNYEMNVYNNPAIQTEELQKQTSQQGYAPLISQNKSVQTPRAQQAKQADQQPSFGFSQQAENEDVRSFADSSSVGSKDELDSIIGLGIGMQKENQSQLPKRPDTVQVRIEPFVPMTVPSPSGSDGLFAGQVFLLRHVQIEDRHLIQGFQLNEDELLTQITESARQLLRRGMGYEISKIERPDAAFAAILQFDFGEVVLNLLEQEPGLILARVQRIRNWFYGILVVVWLSVLIAMVSLWKNLREQVQLSRKKDDFISAVSHELRTPLTSIRMYTEMLEKNWVKTDGKRREYYTTMRTESERLSRLIENVLDFSRIQRGKKRYDFTLGDVNEYIGEVADMMRPYIERAGFTLEQRYEVLPEFAFDRDAIVQIVINLLDNALKYAKDAEDKRIIIRTRKQKNYVVIEIEDHGPGIPRSQQKKIFDAFYRCEDESTRQNVGTGLGLALVKRFAEAHAGFVEISNVKPTGALFRVALASHSN